MRRDVLTDVAIFSPVVYKGEVEVTGVDAVERYDVPVGKRHPHWCPFPHDLRIQFSAMDLLR
jgi:hypothetical protein